MKIGFVYPDTGVDAEAFSAARAGLEGRIGLANEGGGINGRKIVYEWRNDEMSAEMNRGVVRDLVENVGVVGLVTASVTMTGSASYLAEQRVPVTGMDAEPVWSQYDNMFTFARMSSGAVDTWGRYIQINGGTRALIVIPNNLDSAAAYADRLVRGIQAVGVTHVGTVEYAAATDSPQRIAAMLSASRADVLIGVIDPPALAEILGATRSGGVPLKVTLSAAGYDAALLERFGPELAGTSIMLYFTPLEAGGPAVARYMTAIARYAPQVRFPEQEFAIRSYIQTDMFLSALQAAGRCPTREAIIEALTAMKGYDAGGLIKPIDLGAHDGRPQSCLNFVRVNETGTAFDLAAKELCGNVVPTR